MRLLFLIFVTPLFACYIGNPASPAIMNTGIFSMKNPFIKGTSGYIADYTNDKNYEADQTDPNFDPNQAVRKIGIHSQLASVSIILLERLELFGYVGGSKEHAKLGRDPIANPMEVWADFESSYHFSWAAGAKAVLIQWGQTYFCSDFTYFAVPASVHSYFKFFNRLNLPMAEKQEFYLNEWQISAAIASRFWFLTPYLGGLYLNSRLHVESGPEIGPINYKNEEKIGWFYGITLSLTGRFHLNFERRQRAESSYAFSTVAVF